MKKCILCLALLAFYCSVVAQININSVNYNTISPNETNVLQAIVSNGSSTLTAHAIISCHNSLGEMIFEVTTHNFSLSQGVNNINGISIGFSRFAYGSSSRALYLKNYGQLGSGNYSYCLKIIPFGNAEVGDMYCEDFEAAGNDFLSLVSPYDKDTLDTRLPVLTWTHSEPFNVLARNEYYKILVAEIRKDQSPEQAMISNPVVFSKNFLNSHTVPYPLDAQALEEGKTYAWQVQKISGNVIVNKSDVWSFTVRKPKTDSPNKYVLMKSHNDGGFYTAGSDKLYFRFDEEYAFNHLNYEIRNEKNEKILPEIKKEESTQPDLVTQGLNRFELSLTDYKLSRGYYTLVVLNRKKEKFYLRFYVEK